MWQEGGALWDLLKLQWTTHGLTGDVMCVVMLGIAWVVRMGDMSNRGSGYDNSVYSISTPRRAVELALFGEAQSRLAVCGGKEKQTITSSVKRQTHPKT